MEKTQRKIIRLQEYDYSRAGAYFVTICTQDKVHLFGDICDGKMQLNIAGKAIKKWWLELEHKFDNAKIDKFVVMPNHLHGIIMLVNAKSDKTVAHIGATLQTILQWYKTMTTNRYIRGVGETGWTPFLRKLWQKSYYERVIRNDDELNRAREYILGNPMQWDRDKYNI